MNFCLCGCGQETRLAPYTDSVKGWVLGEPLRFKRGHNSRWLHGRPPTDLVPRKCACGCGAVIDGRRRYRHGHNTRQSGVDFFGEDRGFETLCWAWRLQRGPDGYGRLSGRGLAHRIYYERFKGSIPPGHELHHLCLQRDCVNPNHLRPVVRAEHVRLHAEMKEVA